MVFYRVVRQTDGLTVSSIDYDTLTEAYKKCIPSDESETCRLLLNGVQSEIQKGLRFIRVTCDRGSIWWIQLIDDLNDAVPPISEATAKIDCCHAHK